MPTERQRKRQIRELIRLREKKRRQRKVALLLSAIVIALTLIALTCTSTVDYREESYIVSRGDTLWKLYCEYGEGARWDAWLHEMLTVNDMGHNDDLITGESITLLIAE